MIVAAGLALMCSTSHAQSGYIVTTYDTTSAAGSDSVVATSASSAEEKFLAEHFPYISVCDWHPGMRFFVVPGDEDSFIRTFTDSLTGHEVGTSELAHKVLEYRGHERTERGWFRMMFVCEETQHAYYYEVRTLSFDDYCRRIQGGGVPALAFLGDVDRARELLIGRELWLKSPVVYRDSPSSASGYVESQLRVGTHVRVERVGVGTREYPVKIVFRTDDGQLYFNSVAMSCTNSAMSNEDFIMNKEHHHFAKAFSIGSQSDMKSAKMSEQLLGKYVTLRRACQMTVAGVPTSVRAATKFVVQSVKSKGVDSPYYTLTLTSGGKVYRKDVTFENSSVVGDIDGNDESYFDDLFTIGETYVPSNSEIRHTHTGSTTRRRGSSQSTATESSGDFMNMMGGVVSVGMTREDVRMAKGDPDRTHRLRSGGTQWDYFDGTKVQFNSAGRVSRVIRQ
ncbi:MAG: hypothetical protein IJS59_04655 [Bacteroidaceae bacterium]|nr:hypothetical protein [Bacteroidaceae bacterium]